MFNAARKRASKLNIFITYQYFLNFDYILFQGFKRAACAFFTLLQQITSSNWHEMMNSVAAASGDWAYFYFCLFYITINLVLLDLTIAMTIEMYNAIKVQFFNNRTEGENEENEGVFFEVSMMNLLF